MSTLDLVRSKALVFSLHILENNDLTTVRKQKCILTSPHSNCSRNFVTPFWNWVSFRQISSSDNECRILYTVTSPTESEKEAEDMLWILIFIVHGISNIVDAPHYV